METISELYEIFTVKYATAWLEDSVAFHLCFTGKGQKQYRVFISEDYVELSVKRKVLGCFYWDSIAHSHFDNEKDTLSDVHDCVMLYIESSGTTSWQNEAKA